MSPGFGCPLSRSGQLGTHSPQHTTYIELLHLIHYPTERVRINQPMLAAARAQAPRRVTSKQASKQTAHSLPHSGSQIAVSATESIHNWKWTADPQKGHRISHCMRLSWRASHGTVATGVVNRSPSTIGQDPYILLPNTIRVFSFPLFVYFLHSG